MKKKRIIILGGIGFIGRNLYNSLIHDQHDVTILTDDLGSRGLETEILNNAIEGSILEKDFIERTLKDFDVIYSFAGRSGAADSIKDPYHDLDTNLKGHLNILEACRKGNPDTLLIFPSSRLVYGKPESNPVKETHPLKPESIYAIHKITTEHYYLLYQKLYNVKCVIFRISNPFGPYQRFGSNNYGILNWFIHKAITKEPIVIYGEGNQKRDFIYIDDLVDLLKLTLTNEDLAGKIFNVGYGKGISIKETVDIIGRFVPDLLTIFKPWPEIDKMIETGDYVSDIQYLKNKTKWEPSITIEEGIKRTIEFYARK